MDGAASVAPACRSVPARRSGGAAGRKGICRLPAEVDSTAKPYFINRDSEPISC